MNNNTSPYDDDDRTAGNTVEEPADDLSDFTTAEVRSAANEFAASIDDGIAPAAVAPSPAIHGGDGGSSRNGRGRRSSSIR